MSMECMCICVCAFMCFQIYLPWLFTTKMLTVHIQCLLRVGVSILPGVFLTSFFCVVPESSYSSNTSSSSLLVAWYSNCSRERHLIQGVFIFVFLLFSFLSSPLLPPSSSLFSCLPLPLCSPASLSLSQGTREELSSCEADLLSLNDAPHPLKVSPLSLEQQQQGSPHLHISTA